MEGSAKMSNEIELFAGELHQETVKCPKCGYDNLHPISIDIEHAGNKSAHVTVTAEGILLDPVRDENVRTRGVAISLLYQCEHCPILLEHRFSFHKGSTYWYKIYRYMDGYSSKDPPPQPETIWRD
jgi:hypothetical protein